MTITRLTVHVQCHAGGVAPHGVRDVARVYGFVLVLQSDDLQDAGRGTGSDLYSPSGHECLPVLPPGHRGNGVAVEGTANGCRGVPHQSHVGGGHGEFWSSCEWGGGAIGLIFLFSKLK